MHGHLVAVEIGVERRANQRMKLDRLAFNELWLKRLNAQTVEGWRPVQEDGGLTNNLVEDVPNFGLFLFDEFVRLFDGSGEALCVKPRVDKRLEKLKRHLLRQTALMEFEIR